MSRDNRRGRPRHGRFPRVSGDEPPIDIDLSTPSRFSPRERG